MIAQNIAQQRNRIFLSLFPNSSGISDLACKNVLCRDRLESLCRVWRLHDMAFLGLEIDDNLAGQQAPLRDSPEPPTLVQAAGPWLELRKNLGGLGRKLSSIDGLLEFFVHDHCFRLIFPALQGPRQFAHPNLA